VSGAKRCQDTQKAARRANKDKDFPARSAAHSVLRPRTNAGPRPPPAPYLRYGLSRYRASTPLSKSLHSGKKLGRSY